MVDLLTQITHLALLNKGLQWLRLRSYRTAPTLSICLCRPVQTCATFHAANPRKALTRPRYSLSSAGRTQRHALLSCACLTVCCVVCVVHVVS